MENLRIWNRSSVALLLVCGALGMPEVTFSQFEGLVESYNVSTDETGERVAFVMTVWLKKDKAAIQTTYEGAIPGGRMIYRNDKNMMWVLNTDDKTYVEVPQGSQTEPVPHQSPEDAPKFTKTGKTKTILGYSCIQVIERGDEQETEIWATGQLKDLAGAMENALGGRDSDGSVTNELDRMGMFPLSSITKINGAVVESQEVRKIERKRLSEGLFELPPGYTKQTMDSMIEDMQKK